MKSNLVKSFIALALSSFLLLIFGCKEEAKSVVAPINISFKKEGMLQLYKSETDSIISTFDIELAEDEYETQTGLMHRGSMQNNQAMLFIFPNIQMRSFYMKNTLIPLDIIYLDENKKVVSIQKNAKPMDETSLPSRAPAKYVLEINGGLSDQLNIVEGDSIAFSKN
ncbi:MAG: DUF192 domain-containing protein [Flavobacteriaceae bacterium]|nr:DUF192 domain-containing protein [Flavobacteriaceae bacterium]